MVEEIIKITCKNCDSEIVIRYGTNEPPTKTERYCCIMTGSEGEPKPTINEAIQSAITEVK